MKRYFILFVASFFLLLSSVLALTEAPVDVTRMSLIEIEEAMDKGYITSEQLVNIYLERIEKYDEKFNAINQLNEHAVEQAKQLDSMRREGNIKGKLHGIPIIVKCNIDAYGMPTTAGTKTLKDNMPKQNSDVVELLIDEGAIVIASANMSELAFSAMDSYSSYGHVWNVFNNEKYTPFGSSGGSAVSVKAGFAAAALGTDTNSSVRLPAAGAGLVGLRPTYGLLSSKGVIPYDYERDTVGVLTNTVEDNSLILSIISDGKYRSENSSSLKGVVIGVPTQYMKGHKDYKSGPKSLTDVEIVSMMETSVNKLKEAGATIVELPTFVKDSNLTIANNTMSGITMCYYFDQYIKGTTGTIRSFRQLANSSGHVQALGGYLAGCSAPSDARVNSRNSKKAVYREYVDKVFEENRLDVILYPSIKSKVFKIGDPKKTSSPGSTFGSVIGYPSITLPMAMGDDGFSYSLEFLSKANQEDVLYNVAAGFESINGNKVNPSPLTPSLYTVPENVVKLNKLYEENLEEKHAKVWIEEVKDFYLNYNKLDNRNARAEELLKEYEEEYNQKGIINKLKVKKSDHKVIKVIKIIIKIALVLLALYIGLYIFAYTVYFYKKIRRRIRRYKKRKAMLEAKKRQTKKPVQRRPVTKKVVKKKVVKKKPVAKRRK